MLFMSILVGIALTMVTVGIHGAGTSWWITRLQKKEGKGSRFGYLLGHFKVIYTTSIMLLVLHIIEVMIWALAYLAIHDLEFIQNMEAATYFSIVTFTSLGYGDIVIVNDWRLLSGIQSMAGLFVFGWSTALLFTIFRSLLDIDEEPQAV